MIGRELKRIANELHALNTKLDMIYRGLREDKKLEESLMVITNRYCALMKSLPQDKQGSGCAPSNEE